MMKNTGFIKSFNFAVQGIISSIKTEKNMKFHYLAAFLVIVASLFFDLSKTEFLHMTFSITLVISLELINTAIERCVDLIVQEYNPIAKLVKDVSAGAVLIAALNAVVTAYLLFYDKITRIGFWIFHKVANSPTHLTFVSLCVVVFLTLGGKLILSYRSGGTFFQGGGVSGHSAISFCMATIISFVAKNGLVTLCSFFIAFLVAESRVEGKIHKTNEVVTGGILGICVAIFIFKVVG